MVVPVEDVVAVVDVGVAGVVEGVADAVVLVEVGAVADVTVVETNVIVDVVPPTDGCVVAGSSIMDEVDAGSSVVGPDAVEADAAAYSFAASASLPFIVV